MQKLLPVDSAGGVTGFHPTQGLLENSEMIAVSWFGGQRSKYNRSRRGRRRYRGVFFKGKSLYVRGSSGHVYDHRFLRTKHRAKILQLSYTL